MTDRPAPPENKWAPEFTYAAEPDPSWRLVTGKRCRQMTGKYQYCRQPSVAEMNRGYHVWGRGTVDSFWAYCPAHLYGRWVEDGKVMNWVMRKKDADD